MRTMGWNGADTTREGDATSAGFPGRVTETWLSTQKRHAIVPHGVWLKICSEVGLFGFLFLLCVALSGGHGQFRSLFRSQNFL